MVGPLSQRRSLGNVNNSGKAVSSPNNAFGKTFLARVRFALVPGGVLSHGISSRIRHYALIIVP